MNINEFVKEFNEALDKTQCVKSHITKKYIPYEQKMAICKNIINSADYTPTIDDLDKKYYCPNTPLRFVLFSMSIVDSYTDIKLTKIKDGRDVIGGFNKLNSINFFEIFFKELDKEYREMDTILKMTVDDTINKENNLIDFLDTKFNSLKIVYNTIVPILENEFKNFSDNREI